MSAAREAPPLKLLSRIDWVGGCRVFSRYHLHPGGGLPLVFVHGLGMSSAYLAPLAGVLARHHTVYAPDLPGYGRSQRPGRLLRLPELADALAAWMDTLGIETAALVGNSMGCQTIIQLALRHPRRVAAAALIGPVVDPSGRSMLLQMLRGVWNLGMDEPPRFWPVALRDYLANGPLSVMRELRWAIDYPLEADLPRVQVPLLALRGERDRIVSRDWLVEIARLAPFGSAAEIPHAAHVANFSDPETTGLLVRAFLRSEQLFVNSEQQEAYS